MDSRSSQYIDVHQFDYSYQHLDYPPLELTDLEKKQWMERLIASMKNPIAIHGARLIVANIGHEANQDHTNKKSADDILVLLAKHVLEKDKEFLPMIEEQLQDMLQLGQCAQGRTTRLWQLYKAIK